MKATEARTEDAVLQGFQDARNRLQEPGSSDKETDSGAGAEKPGLQNSEHKNDSQNGSHEVESKLQENQTGGGTADSHSSRS